MLKTKIAITKWVKNNFKNVNEFEGFLEYDYLNSFVQDGKKLLPKYEEEYELKKTIVILNTETTEIHYYGSECASMLLGFSSKEVNKQARSAKKEAEKEENKRKAEIRKA